MYFLDCFSHYKIVIALFYSRSICAEQMVSFSYYSVQVVQLDLGLLASAYT